MSEPAGDVPTLVREQDDPAHRDVYLANGLVGLRIGAVPLLGGTTLVNGYFGVDAENVESSAPVPYPLAMDVTVDRVSLSNRPDLASFDSQAYDLATGELTSRFDFTVGDGVVEKSASIETLTFCSRTSPTLVLQEVRVEVDEPCLLKLRPRLDTDGILGDCLERKQFDQDPSGENFQADGVVHWESHGGLSSCGVAYATEFSGEDLLERSRNDIGHEGALDSSFTEYVIDARPGTTYVLRQTGSLVPDLLHREPHWQAVRLLRLGSWYGFDTVRANNRRAWAELWKGRVTVAGASEEWQELLDAAFFYLHSSVHASAPCSVSPYGLGNHEGYRGHVFVDTEWFVFPPTLFTNPDAARTLLEYRADRLEAARKNAQLNGLDGIQFPWQSGDTGDEVTAFWAAQAGGVGLQHVNMGVANAFIQYEHATRNESFTREAVWPVVSGVAEWIVSRVTDTDRGYEIQHVTGIDELVDNVDNNAFTNMMAKVVLDGAVSLADRLDYEPNPEWEAIRDEIVIPVDDGVIRKHDTHTGAPDEEVLTAFFPIGYSHDSVVDAATIQAWLAELKAVDDGDEELPLLPLIGLSRGVFAARAGDPAVAKRLFDTTFDYVQEPFSLFMEWGRETHRQRLYEREDASASSISDVGNVAAEEKSPFITNAGSLLTSVLLGLTGLEIDAGDPEDWPSHPIVLPDGWERIEVDRIWVRNRPAQLVAVDGADAARLEFHDDGEC